MAVALSETPPQPSLLDVPAESGVRIGRHLHLRRNGEQIAVFWGSVALHLFDSGDRAGRAATMASLARAGLASESEIGAGFGVHRNTVGRFKGQLAREGLAALLPVKPGPRGRHKVTPQVLKVIEESPELGPRAMVRRIEERTGIKLSVTMSPAGDAAPA